MLNVGSIINGAFALPARSSAAFAAWVAIYTLPGVAGWFVAQRIVLSSPGNSGSTMEYLASNFLLQLATLLIVALLTTASLRIALRPQEPSLAGLRLGMDELRTAGVTILMGIVFGIGIFVFAAVVGVALVMVGFGTGEAPQAGVGTILLFAPILLVLAAVFVWLQVRLSLVFALTFVRRRITIGESWELTRGRFWMLFGGYLVLFLVMLVLWIVTAAVASGSYLSSLMQTGMDPEAVQALATEQMSQISTLTVLGWLLGGVVGALGISLYSGATATVVRGLGIDDEEIARTFA